MSTLDRAEHKNISDSRSAASLRENLFNASYGNEQIVARLPCPVPPRHEDPDGSAARPNSNIPSLEIDDENKCHVPEDGQKV